MQTWTRLWVCPEGPYGVTLPNLCDVTALPATASHKPAAHKEQEGCLSENERDRNADISTCAVFTCLDRYHECQSSHEFTF